MKEVKIITLKAHQRFARSSFDDLNQIIEDMYKKGYEFKGTVPSEQVGYGSISEIKLIFDKEM